MSGGCSEDCSYSQCLWQYCTKLHSWAFCTVHKKINYIALKKGPKKLKLNLKATKAKSILAHFGFIPQTHSYLSNAPLVGLLVLLFSNHDGWQINKQTWNLILWEFPSISVGSSLACIASEVSALPFFLVLEYRTWSPCRWDSSYAPLDLERTGTTFRPVVCDSPVLLQMSAVGCIYPDESKPIWFYLHSNPDCYLSHHLGVGPRIQFHWCHK